MALAFLIVQSKNKRETQAGPASIEVLLLFTQQH